MNRIENAVRDELLTWLRADRSHPNLLVDLLSSKSQTSIPECPSWQISSEIPFEDDSRPDILLTCGSVAVVVELKVDARETISQYEGYRGNLEAQGYQTFVFGVLKNTEAQRGRQKLIQSGFESVCNGRLSWSDVFDATRNHPDWTGLVAQLRNLIGSRPPSTSSVSQALEGESGWKIGDLESNPKALLAFFDQVLASSGIAAWGTMMQAGNSCINFAFGKESWARWFGDGDKGRLMLSFDQNRPSVQRSATLLYFTISLWNKRRTSLRKPKSLEKLQMAARILKDEGFITIRNIPSDWHHQMPWDSPFPLENSGLFYANAYDEPNFSLNSLEMDSLGWHASIERIANRAKEIATVMDQITSAG